MPITSWAVVTVVLVMGLQQEQCSGEQQAEVSSHDISWWLCVCVFDFPSHGDSVLVPSNTFFVLNPFALPLAVFVGSCLATEAVSNNN